jgi:iron complex outermembrane recepter protein
MTSLVHWKKSPAALFRTSAPFSPAKSVVFAGCASGPTQVRQVARGSYARFVLLCALGAVVLWTAAGAQAPSQVPINVSIPAGPLPDALNELAQQMGLQVLFPSKLVAQLRSPAVKGSLTAEEVLRRLLANTGLRFEFVNLHTVTLLGVESPDPEPSTQAIEAIQPDSHISSTPDHSGSTAPHRNVFARLLGLFGVCGSAAHHSGACAQNAAAPEADTRSLDTIIVSARKRDESLAAVPASITVFTSDTLESYNIQSFTDYATKTPNVSFSYGGGPTGIADARTVAIRGITGQNLYGTAGASGVYIDDTPVPDSVDPRVLDIENIEVLKGPQGTLFGEGSLGGNVRLITKKPNLERDELSLMADAGVTSGGGSADGGGDVIGNLVLAPDILAIRTLLFFNNDAGYLTRTFPDPTSPAVANPFLLVPRTSVGNQGAVTTYGGSVATLLKVTENFKARFRIMFQNMADNGFPATFAPLPSFTPEYTLNRAFDVQPHAADNWTLSSLDLNYKSHGWTYTSSSSFFYRRTQDVEDSTYGTQQILASYYRVTGLPNQPYLWDGEHYHDQITEEMRISFDPVHDLSGTIGAFYSHTHTKFTIPPTYAIGLVAATIGNTVVGPWPNDEVWTQADLATQKDTSLFGELYYKILEKFVLTLGARGYWLSQDSRASANGFLDFGPSVNSPQHNSESGLNPKIGVSYQVTENAMAYASASEGFRAGGAQRSTPFCTEPNLPAIDISHLKSDTLWSYEIGTKVQLPDPGILISAAAFHIDWKKLQQQVALPCGAYFDINGQAATISGGEVDISGHFATALQVRIGAGYAKTDITEPGALGDVGLQPGSRIPGTPAWNGSLGGVYTRMITSDVQGFVAADYSYTGNRVSLLNGGGGQEAKQQAYSLINARFGIDIGKSEVSLDAHNLTNSKPNLGELGYLGYAQYNSAAVVVPQVATLQPLTMTLQFKRTF